MKLTEILDEIKIQNPNHIFHITDKGIQVLKDMGLISNLGNKYKIMEDIVETRSETYNIANIFSIFSKNGENIIKDKNNTLEEYIKIFMERWEDDEESAKSYLKDFMKNDFITKIKI
jgi:hypothetical protein